MPSYDSGDTTELYEQIIGLGGSSIRKSHYPQLLKRLEQVSLQRRELMKTLRTVEEREEELVAALAAKEALLAEVHHRVKNNLQLMISVFSLAVDRGQSDPDRAIRRTMERMEAVAAIYSCIVDEELYVETSLGVLVSRVFESHRTRRSDIRIDVTRNFSGESTISIDRAVSLALIVDEVISNVFVHAFDPDAVNAKLDVMLYKVSDDPVRYRLEIRDNGRGWLEKPNDQSNTGDSAGGLTLIEMLSDQIGARYGYGPRSDGASGTEFTIDI